MWRIGEEEYNEEGSLKLSKNEIMKALVDLDAGELSHYFKRHTKIRRLISDSGNSWEEHKLNTTDTAYLTTIIEDSCVLLFGAPVCTVANGLLDIAISLLDGNDCEKTVSLTLVRSCKIILPPTWMTYIPQGF